MRLSLTTPDRRQTPPPLAVVRQRKTPAAPRYTVSASGSPVRNENLLLQLKFCSLQSPMHYLSCEKSGLDDPAEVAAVEEGRDVLRDLGQRALPRLERGPRHVRRDDQIRDVRREQRLIVVRRLDGQDVDADAAEPARPQRVREGRVVDQRAARRVDQERI